MLGNFWNTVAGKLTERLADIAAPALVFWTGGVLAWVFAGSGWAMLSQRSAWARLTQNPDINGQSVAAKAGVAVVAVLIVTLSAIAVERLTLPALRVLEGYWPGWLGALTERRRRAAQRAKAADNEAWQQLQRQAESAEMTAEQRLRLAKLEHRRRHRPILDHELLPTRIGNILRACETRPYHRYRLRAVIIWPRLWMVLPDLARQELANARRSLDAAVATVIWAVGFVAFTPLAWWAAPVGILTAAIGIAWTVPARAEVFADLVECAYDLYRGGLYRQLRWPLPQNPVDEHRSGEELTQYLVRGSDKDRPQFTAPV
jgi:hypothetical protein